MRAAASHRLSIGASPDRTAVPAPDTSLPDTDRAWTLLAPAPVSIQLTLIAAAFAVLDAREAVHQVGVARPLLAVVAGAVTTLHAAAAFSLVLLVRAAR